MPDASDRGDDEVWGLAAKTIGAKPRFGHGDLVTCIARHALEPDFGGTGAVPMMALDFSPKNLNFRRKFGG